MPGKHQRVISVCVEKNSIDAKGGKKATLEDLNLEVLAKFNRLLPANERELGKPKPQATTSSI